MRGAVVVLVLMLAGRGNSSAPLAQTSPSPSANAASASPSATPVPTGDLISVAAQVYPLKAGQYVTCDYGYGGPARLLAVSRDYPTAGSPSDCFLGVYQRSRTLGRSR